MRPSHVRKALHRRLAYLEAELERGTLPDRLRSYYADEAEALRYVMEQSGLFDAARLERHKRGVVEKVMPIMDRRRARVREAMAAAESSRSVEDIVDSLAPRSVDDAELEALRELARRAGQYHEDCGHGLVGATAQCDSICEAWKAWRAVMERVSAARVA